MGLVCIDAWEVHCIECGEPDCYRSCGKYRPSRTGRCGRMETDGGRMRFLEWGKLELLWHGGMANVRVAGMVRRLNGIVEPLALALGPQVYRIFRSVRWRIGKVLAWHKVQPRIWRVAVEAERAVKLRLILRDRELNVTGEWKFVVSGQRSAERSGETADNYVSDQSLQRQHSKGISCPARQNTFEIALPKIKAGAMFGIYPDGGADSSWLRFLKNELVTSADQPPSLNCQSELKCITWDLDGVIWDGTLSEGEDVTLRPGVMETIKALDEAGIVSSVCSKNDADIALVKLKELGIEEWFVFPQINWGPKSESIKNLAREMNIGLDAVAFVDDREENRKEVRANCPVVRVWDENECLGLGLEEVEKWKVKGGGGMGRRRRLAYREEMVRRGAALQFSGDGAAFAEASGLSFELLPVEGERIGRCRELVQRTNQLNLTARRYDEKAFDELLAKCECTAVRVWDRYGDYGIVGFIAKLGMHLVECCFSCRSAGRGIERKVLAAIADGKGLTADMVATERNAPIREIVREFIERV